MVVREDGWIVACESAHCVAVKFEPDSVKIGHSDGSSHLTFTWEEWVAFAEGIMEGDFSNLTA